MVARALWLAEDTDEVVDPLLVAPLGQQRHDDQLNAQEHEQVAPFGLDAEHGDSHCGGFVTIMEIVVDG